MGEASEVDRQVGEMVFGLQERAEKLWERAEKLRQQLEVSERERGEYAERADRAEATLRRVRKEVQRIAREPRTAQHTFVQLSQLLEGMDQQGGEE